MEILVNVEEVVVGYLWLILSITLHLSALDQFATILLFWCVIFVYIESATHHNIEIHEKKRASKCYKAGLLGAVETFWNMFYKTVYYMRMNVRFFLSHDKNTKRKSCISLWSLYYQVTALKASYVCFTRCNVRLQDDTCNIKHLIIILLHLDQATSCDKSIWEVWSVVHAG